MRFVLALAAALGVAAPTVTAQGKVVVPPFAANEEGNSLDQEPFGDDTMHHLQFVDGGYLASIPFGRTITAISYRADKQFAQSLATSTLYRGGTPIWYLRMANTSTSPFQPSSNWPDRPDQGPPDPNWPFAILARPISLPNLAIPPQGVPPFALRLPLDQPFVWSGPHLGIDHYTYDPNGTSHRYFVDAVQQTAIGGMVTQINGSAPSCPTGLNRASGVAPDPGGLLEFLLFDAQPNTPAVAMLGTTPQALNLTPAGMPGCFLYTNPLAQVAAQTNALGLTAFRTTVPTSPTFAGAQFLAQWVVADPRIAPLPVATSDGLQFTLGNSPLSQQVAMATVTNTSSIATAGFTTLGRGIVCEIEWQ